MEEEKKQESALAPVESSLPPVSVEPVETPAVMQQPSVETGPVDIPFEEIPNTPKAQAATAKKPAKKGADTSRLPSPQMQLYGENQEDAGMAFLESFLKNLYNLVHAWKEELWERLGKKKGNEAMPEELDKNTIIPTVDAVPVEQNPLRDDPNVKEVLNDEFMKVKNGYRNPVLPMDKMQQHLLELNQRGNGVVLLIYSNGDLPRYILGAPTRNTYLLPADTSKGQLVDREGQLWMDEKGKTHCILMADPKKQAELLKKQVGLSDEEVKSLLKGENVAKGDKLYKMDAKTGRAIRMDMNKVRIQKSYHGHHFTQEEKDALLKGKKVKIEFTDKRSGQKKKAFLEWNPRNNVLTQKRPMEVVPKKVHNIELKEKERQKLAKGITVMRNDLVDDQGERYTGYITMNNLGDIEVMKRGGRVKKTQYVKPTLDEEKQVRQNNEGTVLQGGTGYTKIDDDANVEERIAEKQKREEQKTQEKKPRQKHEKTEKRTLFKGKTKNKKVKKVLKTKVGF